MRFHSASMIILGISLGLAGCSAAPSNVNHLKGKVTFDGKPVPAGRVFFLPDPIKNTKGQGGFADIKDGAYDSNAKGAGAPSGALIVRIDGFDGSASPGNPLGKALFLNYETSLELTPNTPTHDFVVPNSAAQSLPKGGETEPP